MDTTELKQALETELSKLEALYKEAPTNQAEILSIRERFDVINLKVEMLYSQINILNAVKQFEAQA